MRNYFFISLFLFCLNGNAQRIGNYVANGSFEEYYDCNLPYNIIKAKHWAGIDSSWGGGVWLSVCNGLVPKWSGLYQFPHSGQAYYGGVFYYTTFTPTQQRTPARNRLKATLQAGKTYCVRFYVNVSNGSPYAIDGIGVYFGGSEIDTITYYSVPLSYITPQVQNSQGNIITDTLNWVAITGTFTANGTEKYLLIGNFLSDEDTDTLMINPTNLPMIYSEFCVDDVSCIPIDLEAYAGRDTTIYLGDSTYIGREKDFAIDSGCVWYKLPSATAIDTISGMWVKPPIGTHTYVVRQELECSALKWDTVVVRVREFDVGLNELSVESLEVKVYPNPASDFLIIESAAPNNQKLDLSIIDITGKILLNKQVEINNYLAAIELNNIENGVYMLVIKNDRNTSVTKKLVVEK